MAIDHESSRRRETECNFHCYLNVHSASSSNMPGSVSVGDVWEAVGVDENALMHLTKVFVEKRRVPGTF